MPWKRVFWAEGTVSAKVLWWGDLGMREEGQGARMVRQGRRGVVGDEVAAEGWLRQPMVRS